MNRISVSIILPVYNVEKYIKKCLDSLVNQSLSDIEIILVDDCSTDLSGQICDEYKDKDKRIKVIHNKENIKQGLSRNKGIEIAKGDYLSFVDPDDWIEADYYKKLVKHAKKGNYDIVKGARVKVFQDGRLSEEKKLNHNITQGIENGKPLFALFRYQHQTAIFRKELFEDGEARYPDLPNSQDVIFLLRITYKANSFKLVNDSVYYYRQYSQSTVHKKTQRYFESYMKRYLMEIDLLNKFDIPKEDYLFAFQSFTGIFFKLLDDNSLSEDLFDYKTVFFRTLCEALGKLKYVECDYLNSLLLISTENKYREKIIKKQKKTVFLRKIKAGLLGKR